MAMLARNKSAADRQRNASPAAPISVGTTPHPRAVSINTTPSTTTAASPVNR